MERVLNQEEIDAMVSAARGGQPTGGGQARDIKPCTFRQSGQLTGTHVHALSGLHETFARALTQSLGAYLRVAFEAALVSVEQLPYCDFLERVSEVTYFVSLNVPQTSASVGLQIDHALVFPLIDILLGGTGKCDALPREVSEIEEQIVEGVARLICHELDATWAPLAINCELEQRQSPAQIQHFLSPTEKTLCLSFEIRLAERRGNLNLVVPASISNTLIRKLSIDMSHGKTKSKARIDPRLADKILNCGFPITLGLTQIQLPVHELLELKIGDICDLRVPLRSAPSLLIADRGCFRALPVRSGDHRAAQVGELLPFVEERTMSDSNA